MYCQFDGLSEPSDNCSAGYYCIARSSTPEPIDGSTGNRCPPGFYCPSGSGWPTPCSPGTYSASEGNTHSGDCQPCDFGEYCEDYNLTMTSGASPGVTSCIDVQIFIIYLPFRRKFYICYTGVTSNDAKRHHLSSNTSASLLQATARVATTARRARAHNSRTCARWATTAWSSRSRRASARAATTRTRPAAGTASSARRATTVTTAREWCTSMRPSNARPATTALKVGFVAMAFLQHSF